MHAKINSRSSHAIHSTHFNNCIWFNFVADCSGDEFVPSCRSPTKQSRVDYMFSTNIEINA
ncbi:hypothetical protein NECAME_07116 [Necator americanus]|uniref:Uncharacterized protein n=1 Tax=Necator americanus TaxID=51031 RepID=W2TQL1_NECAM|nr:hypothetical protein NECAME_07116 [Necator americanus]ETN83964.1 hypothetical protein NECAME_07116 [Necator americanus]